MTVSDLEGSFSHGKYKSRFEIKHSSTLLMELTKTNCFYSWFSLIQINPIFRHGWTQHRKPMISLNLWLPDLHGKTARITCTSTFLVKGFYHGIYKWKKLECHKRVLVVASFATSVYQELPWQSTAAKTKTIPQTAQILSRFASLICIHTAQKYHSSTTPASVTQAPNMNLHYRSFTSYKITKHELNSVALLFTHSFQQNCNHRIHQLSHIWQRKTQ